MRNIIFSIILIQGIFCGNVGRGWDYTSDVDKARAQYNDPSTSDEDRASIAEAYPEIANPSSHSSGGTASEQTGASAVDTDGDRRDFSQVQTDLLEPLQDQSKGNSGDGPRNKIQKVMDGVRGKSLAELEAINRGLEAFKTNSQNATSEQKKAAAMLEQVLQPALEEKRASESEKPANQKPDDGKSAVAEAAADKKTDGFEPTKTNWALIGENGKKYPSVKLPGGLEAARDPDDANSVKIIGPDGSFRTVPASSVGVKVNEDGTLSKADKAPTLPEGVKIAPLVYQQDGTGGAQAFALGSQVYFKRDGQVFNYENGGSGIVKAVSEKEVPESINTAFGSGTTLTSAETGAAAESKPVTTDHIFWGTTSALREPASVGTGGTTETSKTTARGSTPSAKAPGTGTMTYSGAIVYEIAPRSSGPATCGPYGCP